MSLRCHPALNHCELFKVMRRACSNPELNPISLTTTILSYLCTQFSDHFVCCVLRGAPGSIAVPMHQEHLQQYADAKLLFLQRALGTSWKTRARRWEPAGKQCTQAPIKNSKTSLISGWWGSLHCQQCLIQVLKAKLKSFFTRFSTLISRKEHL